MQLIKQRLLAPQQDPARTWMRRHVLQPFLDVPVTAADLTRRGVVPVNPERAESLKQVALHFLSGCNAMFGAHPLEVLDSILARAPLDRRGFIAEGAGMGAVIRDALSVRRGLLAKLLQQHGDRYEYLIVVGVGWGLARVPWREKATLSHVDPVVGPLAMDGRGFHDLYFKPSTALHARHSRMSADQSRVYDTGLGRALWFIASGCPERATDLILACSPTRQADLTAGLGLAMAYVGASTETDWRTVLSRLGHFQADLGQGVCFALEAHRRSGCRPDGFDQAATMVCGMSAEQAAHLAKHTRPISDNARRTDFEAFHAWRQAIKEGLATHARRKAM